MATGRRVTSRENDLYECSSIRTEILRRKESIESCFNLSTLSFDEMLTKWEPPIQVSSYSIFYSVEYLLPLIWYKLCGVNVVFGKLIL